MARRRTIKTRALSDLCHDLRETREEMRVIKQELMRRHKTCPIRKGKG